MAQDDRFDLARLERLERRLQALWPHTKAHAPPSFTTVPATKLRWTRWSELRSDVGGSKGAYYGLSFTRHARRLT